MWFVLDIIFEFIIYLIVDNITKFILSINKEENRFNIFVYECLIFGFLIGFISFYHHITFLLIFLLFIHIIGIFYIEKRFYIIKDGFKIFTYIFIQIYQSIRNHLYNFISNYIFNRSSSKPIITKKIPQKYLYSYHLKPTNDLRLQQSSSIQSLSRPGIFNLHGTTCSLNALLQSLASLNSFCSSLQRNINFSRFNYDPIVSTFIDLIVQLRNDHRTTEYKHWTTPIDTSLFISKLNVIYPNLLTKHITTDIGELFQCILDVMNNALSKQTLVYSTNITEQVQNKKLTTFSLDFLNKIFVETEAQLYNKITLDNLDAQTSYIIQYVDLTWLLHHIQLGSIIKHMFSGQLLHAYCCNNCSHVRFHAEPFQILILPVNKTSTTLEKIISQLTNVDIIDSISCSYCSNQIHHDHERKSRMTQQGTLLTTISPTASPLVNTHLQPSGQMLFSTPISTPITVIPSSTTTTRNYNGIKCQTMIANFPSILCIQLKRFTYDHHLQTTIKLNTHIFIEPEKILDLSHMHYTTWLGLTNVSITIPSRYRLIAVCLHLSKDFSSLSIERRNSNHGHYVCLYRTDNSRWFLCDDERITEINQIENIFQTSYVTENCYLLFYERYL
ncbi:unnamed protein product [Rotaria sordida]|uniref:ubiquitinyl hydrolase 1 n=1 Tax=Rotaria sordida TaxID=392033 RepID=A0A815B009_9BILA|nr:unnamed protein product [Rotaria sordida]